MSIKSISRLLLISALAAAAPAWATDAPTQAPAPSAPATPASAPLDPASAAIMAQVRVIMGKIQAKIDQGLKKESDYTPELAEFDALLAAHKGEKTNAIAFTQYAKDVLYLVVFNEPDKGLAGYKQIAADYPDTDIGKQIADLIPQVQLELNAEAAKTELVVGKPFPPFSTTPDAIKDLDGKPLSLDQYKGKVVLIDFWATWCPNCMLEMPNLVSAYDKYHSKGFDVIGVSLDHAEDLAKLPQFLTEHKMPWREYCDGKFWFNALSMKYGVMQTPSSYLLDSSGNIFAIDPMGSKLVPAIEAALYAEKAKDAVGGG